MTPEERARRVSDRMEEFCQRSRCEDCEKLVVDEINEAIRAAGERARKALDDRLVEVAAAAAATEREACARVAERAADDIGHGAAEPYASYFKAMRLGARLAARAIRSRGRAGT